MRVTKGKIAAGIAVAGLCATQPAVALASGTLAALPEPGGYTGWLRILLVFICILPWLAFCQWVDRDTEYVRRMDHNTWNGITLGGGTVGLIVWLLLPWNTVGLFAAGFGLWFLATVGTWELVGVHDGARPLITCEDVGRAVDVLVGDNALDGVVLGVPCNDTIKLVDGAGLIAETPDRRSLWRAQTPQIFRWRALYEAYAEDEEVLRAATDDASLVEARGGRVKVVEGSAENLKITDASDLRYAEHVLAQRRK